MNWYWNGSLGSLDSEADLRSSAFTIGSGLDCGNCSSPMSLATTLGDPVAVKFALLSRENLGASLHNFDVDLAPSLGWKTGTGSGGFDCFSTGVTISGWEAFKLSELGGDSIT